MKWRMKIFKVLIITVFSAFLLTVIHADRGESATTPQFKWKFYAFTGAMHPITNYFQSFAKEVTKKTGGKLEIKVYPGGQLPYKAFDVVQIVGQRNVELGDAYTGFIAGHVHLCDLFTLPFLITSQEDVQKAYGSIKEVLDEKFKKKNSQILFKYVWPAQTLWSIKPLSSLDNLKGRKMRGKSPGENAVFKAYEAIPVTLTTTELPSALERGVVDGIISTAMNCVGTGIADYLKYAYLIELHYAVDFILMNRKAYDELSPDLKKILTETAMEYQKKMLAEIPVKLEKAAREKVKSQGTRLTEPLEKDRQEGPKKLRPYWEAWANKYGKEAQDALRKVREAVGK